MAARRGIILVKAGFDLLAALHDVLGLHLYLDLVEALAVDAIDVGLGDEGVAVDRLDDAEDRHRLDFAAHDEQHLDILLAIPAGAVDDGAAAVGLVVDGRSNLAPVR